MLVLPMILVACGAPPQESTLQTHSTRAPGADAPSAVPALGDVRWIEVGAPVRDVSASPRRIVAVLEDGSTVSFDLESGARATVRPADPAAPPTMPSLSPSGDLLAVCVGTEVSIIDVVHGTYGLFSHEAECSAPALWSHDGARVYVMEHDDQLRAFDVSTGAALARAAILGPDTFVTSDGAIVSEGDHRVIVLDEALAPVASYAMPAPDAQEDSAEQTFLLAALDRSTFVYAAGDSSYQVFSVHEGTPTVLWHSSQSERWVAVIALPNERAFVLVERDGASLARIVGVRTGESVGETPDITRPFAVSADGTLAAAGVAARIAVMGLH